MQQKGGLVVAGDDFPGLQEIEQLGQLSPLVPGAPGLHPDDRRVVPVPGMFMRGDALGVAEGSPAGVGIGPVGGVGHPPAAEIDDGRTAAVVDAERHGVAVGEMVGEAQQVHHAGAPEPVDALVVVADHADVAVAAGQPEQQALLDIAGVLVLVADQVPYPVGDGTGDAVIVEEFGGPTLQVAEVRAALFQEQVPVAGVAPAQGGVERVPGRRQLVGVNHFVADPLEVLAAVGDHQAGLPPPPALPFQDVQVGAEDMVEVSVQETFLTILVQHLEVGRETGLSGVGAQDAAAPAVDGADAHPVEVSGAAGGGGQPDETLAQFAGGGAGVGAQRQFRGPGLALEQDVGSPEGHRQGLAGAGAGDAQRGPVQVADQLPLALVQARVKAQYGGGYT